jgi:hypothetical protein
MNAQFNAVFGAAVVTILFGCGTETTSNSAKELESASIGVVQQDAEAHSLYTVADYDPGANPSVDLAATVSQASKSGKRIILEIGGQW